MSDGRSHRRSDERRRSHEGHERRERTGSAGRAAGSHARSREDAGGQAGGRVRNVSLPGGRGGAGGGNAGAGRRSGGAGKHAASAHGAGYDYDERGVGGYGENGQSRRTGGHSASGRAGSGRSGVSDHIFSLSSGASLGRGDGSRRERTHDGRGRQDRTDSRGVPQMRGSKSYGSRSSLAGRLPGTPSWLGRHKFALGTACLVLVLLVAGISIVRSCSAAGGDNSDSSYTASHGLSVGDKFVARATDGDSSGYWNSLLTSPLTAIDTGGVTITGANIVDFKLQPLLKAIEAIEDSGYDVGISLVDTTNGIAITYNADSAFYSASSIKGPYVAALGKYELGDGVTSQSGRISDTLEWSDNDAYATLRSIYGNSCMASLVSESGADQLSSTGINDEVESVRALQSGDSISDNNYEFVTPNQLTAMWCVVDEYLASDEGGAEFLASEFSQPATSGIKYVGSAYGTTWSKAGWYPGEGDAYETTVDAGVVREQTGDVVVTIMLTKGEDFTALDSVALPLLQLHQELLG